MGSEMCIRDSLKIELNDIETTNRSSIDCAFAFYKHNLIYIELHGSCLASNYSAVKLLHISGVDIFSHMQYNCSP